MALNLACCSAIAFANDSGDGVVMLMRKSALSAGGVMSGFVVIVATVAACTASGWSLGIAVAVVENVRGHVLQ